MTDTQPSRAFLLGLLYGVSIQMTNDQDPADSGRDPRYTVTDGGKLEPNSSNEPDFAELEFENDE
jgi:hypothetical protein